MARWYETRVKRIRVVVVPYRVVSPGPNLTGAAWDSEEPSVRATAYNPNATIHPITITITILWLVT